MDYIIIFIEISLRPFPKFSSNIKQLLDYNKSIFTLCYCIIFLLIDWLVDLKKKSFWRCNFNVFTNSFIGEYSGEYVAWRQSFNQVY